METMKQIWSSGQRYVLHNEEEHKVIEKWMQMGEYYVAPPHKEPYCLKFCRIMERI